MTDDRIDDAAQVLRARLERIVEIDGRTRRRAPNGYPLVGNKYEGGRYVRGDYWREQYGD